MNELHNDTQAIAARLTAIAERLKFQEYMGIVATSQVADDLRFLLAHVETLTQQVAELTEQREEYHDDAVAFASRATKAEQQRDAAHAALKDAFTAGYHSTWTPQGWLFVPALRPGDSTGAYAAWLETVDTALAASAPQNEK